MKPQLRAVLPILSILASAAAVAQVAPDGTTAPAREASTVVRSRIARFLAGPADRPQGFLLRNGTFVMLPPGIAQQLPQAVGRNTSVSASGFEQMYAGNKTILAASLTIDGVTYQDDAPPAVPAARAPMPGAALAPPPPPPGPPVTGPGGPGLAPPPPPPAPPCGTAAAPPPRAQPGRGGSALPPPPPADGSPAPPPTPPQAMRP